MDKKRILEALGMMPVLETCEGINGLEEPEKFWAIYGKDDGDPYSTGSTEEQAIELLSLDANFCFREIAPFVGSKGYSLRTGYDGAGYEAEIWDMRSMEPEDYEGFGSACDEENIETAILTAFESYLESKA